MKSQKMFKEKIKKIALILKRYVLPAAGILLLVAAGYLGFRQYKNLQDSLQAQKKQTAELANKLDQLQQQTEQAQSQSEQTTKQLSGELDTQKTQTAAAQKQAQLAQSALDVLKKQEGQAISTSSAFPKINTQAIVLVICFDAFNNVQTGSGTIISASGYVLTNKHVVTDSFGNNLDCAALMNDGSAAPILKSDIMYTLTLNADGAGYYPNYDAALLKINNAINTKTNAPTPVPSYFPYIAPNGGGLKQGDSIFIFGYPAASNFVYNVTRGIVSSFSNDNNYINTDAIIDHGNSGGAAITTDGRFVGIPSQKYIANGDYLGQILKVEDLQGLP